MAAVTRTVSVCDVEEVALKDTRAPGQYTSNPVLMRQLHRNVSENDVHCWRLRLEKLRMLSRVDYGTGDEKSESI